MPAFKNSEDPGMRNADRMKGLPESFGIDEFHFRHCFGASHVGAFVPLLTGRVLTVGRHAISRGPLTMGLHESTHVATIYQFLGKKLWDTDFVSRRFSQIPLEMPIAEGDESLKVVDDTLNKQSVRQVPGAEAIKSTKLEEINNQRTARRLDHARIEKQSTNGPTWPSVEKS
jgi:hypothetical protein